MVKRTITLLVVCLLGTAAHAQEWTRFRGPNGTGVSNVTTIPDKISSEDYNWRVKLPGGGHSSPVLWGNRIFTLCTDTEDKAKRLVVCLDAESGKLLWFKSFDSQSHRLHRYNSFAASTPAVDEQRVYVSWTTPEAYTVIAFDHDGNQIWKQELGPWSSQHGGGVSPIVYKDMLIVPNEQMGPSSLLAFDAATGKPRWKIDRPHRRAAYSTPAVRKLDDGTEELIFNSGANGITAVNPLTGKINWNHRDLFELRSCSSPVTVAGLWIGTCGSGGGGNYLVAVRPPSAPGKDDSKLMYTIKGRKAAPYVPTPVVKGDLMFLWSDSGTVSCIDGKTGDFKWRETIVGNFFSSPICVGDRLYNIATHGEMIVLSATDSYKEISRHNLGEMCHATPAIAHGRMYIRTYNHLISIGGKKSVAGR